MERKEGRSLLPLSPVTFKLLLLYYCLPCFWRLFKRSRSVKDTHSVESTKPTSPTSGNLSLGSVGLAHLESTQSTLVEPPQLPPKEPDKPERSYQAPASPDLQMDMNYIEESVKVSTHSLAEDEMNWFGLPPR